MNEIRNDEQNLVTVNYISLLETIITVLQDKSPKNPFKLVDEGKGLILQFDAIAQSVSNTKINNPLGNQSNQARVATVNFSSGSKQDFTQQVQQLKDCLKDYLETTLFQSVGGWVNALATGVDEFEGNIDGNKLSFQYPFQKTEKTLQKRELSLEPQASQQRSGLKFHQLKITIENAKKFREQLKQSLENYIKLRFPETEQDDLKEILADLFEYEQSDFDRLEKLMDTEALGRIQKEAKVIYLEYLKEQIGEHKDLIYLEDLIRRLRLIEDYINDEEKEDGHYNVNYEGISVNYRDLFSRADAFDLLPIITIIEGCLGETEDENNSKQEFIFGLKLKLNGPVQTEGRMDAFDYYLDLLNPKSEKHQEGLEDDFRKKFFVEKVLKIALLYYFVFAGYDLSKADNNPKGELTYNPIANFEEKVLPTLQEEDENKKQKLLGGIKRGLKEYQANQKVQKLKEMLTKFLQQKHDLPVRDYPCHLNVKQGILEKDYQTINQNNSFFHSLQGNPKLALKYISITSPNLGNNSLLSLGVNLHLSEVSYFPTGRNEELTMKYTESLGKVPTIPILLTPKEDRCRKTYQQGLKQYNPIRFSYDVDALKDAILKNESSAKCFFYKVTFALLVYVTLKMLLDSSGKKFFLPIIRLHIGTDQDKHPEEKFLNSVFFMVSHLLNEEHRCSSQGFRVRGINYFKIKNGLNSLYSILPKQFIFANPASDYQLEKLAMIVVSSRESDRARDKKINNKLSNLMGEAIAFQRQSNNNSIRIYTHKTFSDNYGSEQIFSSPLVLIDCVNELYQQGFRHFLYIAKSPYSSTLHLTQTEEDQELFFMSKAVMRSLKGDKGDIKIYPIFFNKYYAINLGQDQANTSLYIQGSPESRNLTEDTSKKTVVFLNLFNGIKVGNDRFYNGVISYATLLNIYEKILDEEDIRNGLINDTPLKQEILEFLTLFHFSRYEKESKDEFQLKLEPYDNIIGDKSVGALSMFNHITGNVEFNSLAFLTEVKKALNIPKVYP